MKAALAVGWFALWAALLSPLLHEGLHIAALLSIGCHDFRFSFSPGISGISSSVEVLCPISKGEAALVIVAGAGGSVALAGLLLAASRGRKGPAWDLSSLAASAILFSNAMSFAPASNDLSALLSMMDASMPWLPGAIGLMLGLAGAITLYQRFK